MAQIQNKQNRDQQYLAVRVGRGPQPLAVDTNTYKTDTADYIEDICPYATFQLSKPAYSESSYSGNVYSGPYHSVRGSFVYHDVKPPPIDKFKLGHVSFVFHFFFQPQTNFFVELFPFQFLDFFINFLEAPFFFCFGYSTIVLKSSSNVFSAFCNFSSVFFVSFVF